MADKSLSSPLKCFGFRLKPKEDLKDGIIAFAKRRNIQAGIVLTCVGSATQVNLRYANRNKGTVRKGFFEIVGLVGTFSNKSAHLHLIVSDKNGKTTAGHLLQGTIIYTTAEIVVGQLPAIQFGRHPDPHTGYHELSVKKDQSTQGK